MPDLATPAAIDDFLVRFYHGQDATLLDAQFQLGAGRVRAVTLRLRCRDGKQHDRAVVVKLTLTDVGELKFHSRPAHDPATLAHGMSAAAIGGLVYLDLMPWDVDERNLHDYRASPCYFAADRIAWEVDTDRATPAG